jgi:hypothetical protein
VSKTPVFEPMFWRKYLCKNHNIGPWSSNQVFASLYLRLTLQDPAKFLGAKLPDLSQWFSSSDIDFKREDIAVLIKRLSSEQKPEKLRFPHIKFPAKRPRQSSPGINFTNFHQCDQIGRIFAIWAMVFFG